METKIRDKGYYIYSLPKTFCSSFRQVLLSLLLSSLGMDKYSPIYSWGCCICAVLDWNSTWPRSLALYTVIG